MTGTKLASVVLSLVLLTAQCWAGAGRPPGAAIPADRKDGARPAAGARREGTPFSDAGRQSFISYCSACHGIDGRGGEHAPGIASGASARDLSDARLLNILGNGIPSAGMPSFRSLGSARLKLIINYLRVLQGSEAAGWVAGNPVRGKELFFGPAACSACHMIHGAGGFLGPDLSSYSLLHSPEDIRQAILNPNRTLGPDGDTVIAVARDGRKFVGIARNEDNFSLQLQTPDGHLYLLMKSGLVATRHEPWSLMPSDYRSRLTEADIRDLIAFLVRAGSGKGAFERQTGGAEPPRF